MRKPTNIFVLFTFGLLFAVLFSGLFKLVITSFKISGLLLLGLPQMLIRALSPAIPVLQMFGLIFGLGSLILAVFTVPVLLFKKILSRPDDNDFDIFN